jgi:hypothetical protein
VWTPSLGYTGKQLSGPDHDSFAMTKSDETSDGQILKINMSYSQDLDEMVFGERWWARQRTALPRNRAMRDTQRGPASGSEMAFGAAPEPGGPAATSIARQVGSQYLSRGSASRRLRWSNLSDSPAAGADAHSSRTHTVQRCGLASSAVPTAGRHALHP